jgi:hypothetical protein
MSLWFLHGSNIYKLWETELYLNSLSFPLLLLDRLPFCMLWKRILL